MPRQDSTVHQLRTRFGQVAGTIGEALGGEFPHVVALVAKWDAADLVPGLSDMDFRVICRDGTTPEDWVHIDRTAGRIHLEMVRTHPEWNRINEHTAGAGMTVAEVADERFHNPEYAIWSLWWGRGDWLEKVKAQIAARSFSATDEHLHLSKFLNYYGPYQVGIDPGINLGPMAPKYPLHSRCWHYFSPPMLSAASLLFRRNLTGKRESLGWLRDNGFITEQVDAVLEQVNAHYETPELSDAGRLETFEKKLLTAFEQLLPRLLSSIEHLDIARTAPWPAVKQQLAAIVPDPVGQLMDYLRWTRIRAARYYFYINAPEHFQTALLLKEEWVWVKKFTVTIFELLRKLAGDQSLMPVPCLARLGVELDVRESSAVQSMLASETVDRASENRRRFYETAVDQFPVYYRVLERALAMVMKSHPGAPTT